MYVNVDNLKSHIKVLFCNVKTLLYWLAKLCFVLFFCLRLSLFVLFP